MKKGMVIGDKESFWVEMKASVTPKIAARVLLSFLSNPYAKEMKGRCSQGKCRIFVRYEHTGQVDDSVIAALGNISLRAAAGAAPKVEEPPMSDGEYILVRREHYSWAAKQVADGALWFFVTRANKGFVFQYTPDTGTKKRRWPWGEL